MKIISINQHHNHQSLQRNLIMGNISIRNIKRCILIAISASLVSASMPKHHSAFIIQSQSLFSTRIIKRDFNGNSNRLRVLHLNDESDTSKLRKEGPKNESTSRNEFSRTIRVSKWFGAVGGSTSKSKNKSLNLSISATESEMSALATRFRLATISSLVAELVVSPALAVTGGYQDNCIEVRGTISTQVKQTCVRTNEDFDVDLEFSFDTTLKAMAATKLPTEALNSGEMEALAAAAQLDRKKPKGRKQTSVKSVKGISAQGVDVQELQNILTEYEVTNDIIEDESCFCTDGIVDVGEVVSQMFRSKLDPYPKKPGSDPITYTFTF